jgi:hypothetical protein
MRVDRAAEGGEGLSPDGAVGVKVTSILILFWAIMRALRPDALPTNAPTAAVVAAAAAVQEVVMFVTGHYASFAAT